jgi:hypothetical protein
MTRNHVVSRNEGQIYSICRQEAARAKLEVGAALIKI